MRANLDNRISPRKNIKTRVVFEDEFSDEFIYFLSTDISLSGIFIESNIKFVPGSNVFLKFSLYEGDKPIEVTGEIMRIRQAPRRRGRKSQNEKVGIGIRFVGLRAKDLQRIKQFIFS